MVWLFSLCLSAMEVIDMGLKKLCFSLVFIYCAPLFAYTSLDAASEPNQITNLKPNLKPNQELNTELANQSIVNSAIIDAHNSLFFMAENYPPANFRSEDEIVGVSVDVLHEIWRYLHLPQKKINIVPWARGYLALQKQENTALFTMSRTAERESKFKWVGPVFFSTHVLIAKKEASINITKKDEVFRYSVATIRGDVSERSLKGFDYPDEKITKVTDIKQAFLMLKSDRVDLIMLSIHGFHHIVSSAKESRGDYKIVWQVNKIGNYFAFNKSTPDVLINTYQSAFDAIEDKRLNILESYRIPEEEH